MKPFTEHTGRALPLDRSDVDTDQIVPARYLRRIERSGFGPFLFAEWRKDPDFVLNRPEFAGATILLAGPNFGSGSSREHAVWALSEGVLARVNFPPLGLPAGALDTPLPSPTPAPSRSPSRS